LVVESWTIPLSRKYADDFALLNSCSLQDDSEQASRSQPDFDAGSLEEIVFPSTLSLRIFCDMTRLAKPGGRLKRTDFFEIPFPYLLASLCGLLRYQRLHRSFRLVPTFHWRITSPFLRPFIRAVLCRFSVVRCTSSTFLPSSNHLCNRSSLLWTKRDWLISTLTLPPLGLPTQACGLLLPIPSRLCGAFPGLFPGF